MNIMIEENNLIVVNHPVIQSKMTMLRDKDTGTKEFRELVKEISIYLGYEALRNAPLVNEKVYTPCGKYKGMVLAHDYAIVPILRAGMGMLDGLLQVLPTAKIGHVGIYRDPESLEPQSYYCKLPELSIGRNYAPYTDVILLDPMIATGGTAYETIAKVHQMGVQNISMISLVTCPVGVNKIHSDFPFVKIITAGHDPILNEDSYIVPGLGDAGDRIFGTK